MKYEFHFYEKELYSDLIRLAMRSYEWEVPAVGLSRIEFCNSLDKVFLDTHTAWEKTVGCYFENSKMVASVWNDASYNGDIFFLFDSKERAQEEELLLDMIKFAKTYGVGYEKENCRIRFVNLHVPKWNDTLIRVLEEHGFRKSDWIECLNMFDFNEKQYEVNLPEGYCIIDGRTSTTIQVANVHRHSFGYGAWDRATEHGHEAFGAVRSARYYDPEFELCVLDPEKRPVAIANIWYDENMPYCELEPLAVCWWERRRGIGTAILHEAMNRVMAKYPKCKGMLGGDQPFYKSIGYKTKAEVLTYHWEKEVFISWEAESFYMNYRKEVE